MTEENQNEGENTNYQPDQQQQAPTLSKSWAVEKAHVPTFTGGKVTHGRKGLSISADESVPFLLLPVDGDVAVVNANTGIRLGTVRGVDSSVKIEGDDDNDDDDGLDADAITSHALSWNDQVVVTCSRNSLIRQYSFSENVDDVKNGKLLTLLKTWGKSGHTLPVTEMEFHCSNIFLATGSVDGSVRIWDIRGGFVTHVFRPLAGGSGGGSGMLSVTSMKWLDRAEQLVIAIGRDDGSISIHDLRDKSQKNVVVLRDHVAAVTCMDWTRAHNNYFVTTGRDAVINLWKVDPIRQHKQKKKNLMAGTTQLEKYIRVHTLPIYEQVEGMVIIPHYEENDNIAIATAGSKGQIRLWQSHSDNGVISGLHQHMEQTEEHAFGETRGGYLNLCCVHGGGGEPGKGMFNVQLTVADAEHNISFLEITKSGLKTIRTIVGHNDDILDLKVVPNAQGDVSQIVVATNSPQVKLFSINDFSCHTLDGHTATVLCVDVTPCGRFVATCGKDKQMRMWDLRTRKCVAVAVGHTEAIGSVCLSRKPKRYDVVGKAAHSGAGAFVVTVSVDRTLKRWNLPGASVLEERSGEESDEEFPLSSFASARAHEKDVNIVAVAPNDSIIATGSQDKTVKLWKSTDLSLVTTLKGHRRGVWDCQFSGLDRVLATASGDRTLKLWSLADYSCVRTFQGHVASVLRVRFLSGGLQLMSSGADGLIKLWTIRTNECESTLDGHRDKVWALDTAAGGGKVISGGADSTILVWQDTTKEEEQTKQADAEQAIILDQRLANHLRRGEYAEAFDIALDREKPLNVLKVVNAIVETEITRGGNGLKQLQTLSSGISGDRLVRLLRYCREWNTRALNSHVALLLVKAIVTTIPADILAGIDGAPEILAGILSYAERHFDRLDRLHASSYLMDFVLFNMGSVDPDDTSDDFAKWENSSKLLQLPTVRDGRIQVGGSTTVGIPKNAFQEHEGSDSDDVITVGESDSDSE